MMIKRTLKSKLPYTKKTVLRVNFLYQLGFIHRVVVNCDGWLS
jgi:hypothetical protein